jgi:hypothetical protein
MIEVAMIRLMATRLTGRHSSRHGPIEIEAARLPDDLDEDQWSISCRLGRLRGQALLDPVGQVRTATTAPACQLPITALASAGKRGVDDELRRSGPGGVHEGGTGRRPTR